MFRCPSACLTIAKCTLLATSANLSACLAMRMPIRRQPAAFGQLVATLSEKQDQQAPKNHQKQYPGIPAEIFFAGAHSCDRCRYCRSSMPAIAWVRLYVLTRGPSSEFDAPRIVRLD